MKVQFNRQVAFNNVVYAKGAHIVPDAIYDHWYFKALVKDGEAVVLEAPAKEELESPSYDEVKLEEAPTEKLETKAEDAPKKRGRKPNGSN